MALDYIFPVGFPGAELVLNRVRMRVPDHLCAGLFAS